jgi:TRAP-type C4-dicarboxylate transport system substrate-binding protein
MTGHVYTPAYVLVGQNRWNSFPEDVRRILEETAKEMQAFVYENGARLDTELLDKIQAESDIEVNEADKDAFIAASDPIYQAFGEQVEGGKEMIDTAISLGQGS